LSCSARGVQQTKQQQKIDQKRTEMLNAKGLKRTLKVPQTAILFARIFAASDQAGRSVCCVLHHTAM
jgi:hypothetical protein